MRAIGDASRGCANQVRWLNQSRMIAPGSTWCRDVAWSVSGSIGLAWGRATVMVLVSPSSGPRGCPEHRGYFGPYPVHSP